MQTLSFPSLDSTPLGGRWFAAREPRAVAVIAPGMAIPASYYDAFAEHLASDGIHVLSFDYRGVGASRHGGLRGDPSTASDWGRLDASAAIDQAMARAGGLPVFLVGHSFGGQVAGLTGRSADLAGVLGIAAQSGWIGHFPGLFKLRMVGTMGLWLPAVATAAGYLPGWAGMKHDVPAGVALEWARWCRSPGYLTDHVRGAIDTYRSVSGPVRLLAITDDDYAPRAAVEALGGFFADAEVVDVDPRAYGVSSLGHFGFFRRSSSPAWDAATSWLLDRAEASARAA